MPNIDPDSVPSTVRKAVAVLLAGLTDGEISEIRQGVLPHEAHHTLGRFIRNSWSLWANDSPLKRDAVKTYGIAHSDDISGLIMNWVWALALERLDFDPQEFVKGYHKHWENKGTDALSAGDWNQEEHGG